MKSCNAVNIKVTIFLFINLETCHARRIKAQCVPASFTQEPIVKVYQISMTDAKSGDP